MTDFFRGLYENLLSDIETCSKHTEDSKKRIECCFHISKSLLIELDKKLTTTVFTTKEEEIDFFKNVKPKFTGLVEFYSLLYKAELFAPDSRDEIIEFHRFELERSKQFLEKHQEFYNYIKGDEQTNDESYFLRKDAAENSTSYDEVLAQIHAREKYIKYLEQKIGEGQ